MDQRFQGFPPGGSCGESSCVCPPDRAFKSKLGSHLSQSSIRHEFGNPYQNSMRAPLRLSMVTTTMMLLLPLLTITMSTDRYRPVIAALAIMTSGLRQAE